jgi:hypothetical protein
MKAILILVFLLTLIPVCTENETCYVSIEIENSSICGGATFQWVFCYNPDEPRERDYHRSFWACISAATNPVSYLPLVSK